jgi:hypothetical protein
MDNDLKIPLLDEVKDIIEKEKTLLNLKVLEQKVEAQEWRGKYEELLSKIADPSIVSSNIKVYEIVADVETKINNNLNDFVTVINKSNVSDTNWCLDASQFNLSNNDIKQIINIKKLHNNKNISVLLLNNCQIDDTQSELCATLLYQSDIKAIDFSFNNLGQLFHSNMMKAIEKQSINLQYLLLHGNMKLSNYVFDNILNYVSKTIWGLTVTLNDINSIKTQSGNNDDNDRNSSSNLKRKGLPHLSLRFLKHLLSKLGHDEESSNDTAARKTNKRDNNIIPENNIKNTSQSDRVPSARKISHGIQLESGSACHLSVLGMMHASLCKESVVMVDVSQLIPYY